VQRFVDAFFSKVGEFGKPPYHPKWREINLGATLPGWTRFEAAQAWLDNQRVETQAEARPELRRTVATGGGTRSAAQRDLALEDPALFQEFLRWRRQQGR
jgi:hypothetical protein